MSFFLCLHAFSHQYLAPEVLRKQPYDNTVDWWCLGSVLYEMLFGLVSLSLKFSLIYCCYIYYWYAVLTPAFYFYCDAAGYLRISVCAHCNRDNSSSLLFRILAPILQQGHARNVWKHPPQDAGDAPWDFQHSLVSSAGSAGKRRHTPTGVSGWFCKWDYAMCPARHQIKVFLGAPSSGCCNKFLIYNQ